MNQSDQQNASRAQKDDAVIDDGVFVWEYNGAPLAFEKFSMVRREGGGFFKKKPGGLQVLTSVASPDDSLNFDTDWEFDTCLYPAKLEVNTRPATPNAQHDRRAVFSFCESKAHLKMGRQNHLTTLNIGYEEGWLVAVEPSVMPYAIMLGRYDRAHGGGQNFTILRTSAMDDFFTLTKMRFTLKLVRTFDAPPRHGKRTLIHYFSGEERIVARELSDLQPPHRTVHLWCDGEQRLRKALFAADTHDVTAIRQGDEELSASLIPQGARS